MAKVKKTRLDPGTAQTWRGRPFDIASADQQVWWQEGSTKWVVRRYTAVRDGQEVEGEPFAGQDTGQQNVWTRYPDGQPAPKYLVHFSAPQPDKDAPGTAFDARQSSGSGNWVVYSYSKP